MLASVVGGLASHSLALLSDAGHMLADAGALALALVLSDAAGSAAAIVAAVCVLFLGWRRADPLVSVALAVLILWSAWKLIARTADVLMEGAPVGLMVADLERTIRETPGVAELHDLHAWTISDGFDVVTVHVVLDGSRHGTEVALAVSDRIKDE